MHTLSPHHYLNHFWKSKQKQFSSTTTTRKSYILEFFFFLGKNVPENNCNFTYSALLLPSFVDFANLWRHFKEHCVKEYEINLIEVQLILKEELKILPILNSRVKFEDLSKFIYYNFINTFWWKMFTLDIEGCTMCFFLFSWIFM